MFKKKKETAKRTVLTVVTVLAALMGFAAPATAQLKCCGGTTYTAGEYVARAWGHNKYGELGDGTTTQRATPVGVQNLGGVKALAGGDHHSVALKQDGTVWAWGLNGSGQLGDGTTTTQRTTPVQVSNLGGVKAVAAGAYFSLALKEDGTVWAWGHNYFGQLGNGNAIKSRITPVQVSNLSGVTAIAAGYRHGLAVRKDGTLWAWGDNEFGQLGDGTTTQRTRPVQVHNLGGVQDIAAGWSHSVALKQDGTVWAWGNNVSGQLGDETVVDHPTPAQVTNVSGVKAIASGWWHNLALKSDGTLWAWGFNPMGELGDGSTPSTAPNPTPVQVSNPGNVTAIAAGGHHSLAVALTEPTTVCC